MPRLGTSDDNSRNQPRSGVRSAMAYPNFRSTFFLKLLGIFLVFFFVRNLMSKDYNQQEKAYLRSIGKTEEEISKYFEPAKQNKSSQTQDIKQLSLEIERLKRDVALLKSKIDENVDGSHTSNASDHET